MRCKRARKHLTALLDGELDERFSGKLESHMAECAACRSERKALERVRKALEGLKTPAFERSVAPDVILSRARSGTGGKRARVRKDRDGKIFGMSLGLRHALAMGALAAVVGIAWVIAVQRGGPVSTDREVLMVEEMELFENLDLIRNLVLLEGLEAEAGKQGESG